MRTTVLAATFLFTAVALSACGGGATTTAPAPTVTVTKAPSAQEEPSEEQESAAPQGTNAEAQDLPNVVGMQLQEAQDTMQAAGFFVLNDKDATGQGRFQVNDRNWVVTRQTPAAGERVTPDTLITLWSKKYGE